MSTQTPQRSRLHRRAAAGGDGQREIESFFARVAASRYQQRLRMLTGTCQFDIAGAGTWRLAVEDGVVTVAKDDAAAAPATCVVSVGAADLLRVLHEEGHLNVTAAMLQELLTITGDFSFAYTVLSNNLLARPVRGMLGEDDERQPGQYPRRQYLRRQRRAG